MWTPATTVLDEPLKILFWEVEDFQAIVVAPFIAQFLVGPIMAFGAAVAAGILTYRLKRGRPSGALRHLVHWLELWPIPGVLPPHAQRYAPW